MSKYTIDYTNLVGIDKHQMQLIEKLNTSLLMGQKDPEKSIMHYGQICEHDDGFLCEHRLQVIVDWLKAN